MSTPLLMGIVNVTPDSFSDGGHYVSVDRAVAHGLALLAEGADWLDVGGESTRPGAAPVSESDELGRVIPVIRELVRQRPDVVISVDTSKARVAKLAVEAGARVVNDVTALSDPEMLEACAGAGLVLMHMRGTPRTMQQDVTYDDLLGEVEAFLGERVARARAAGIEQVWVDPGIGFGKAPGDNPRLIRGIPRLGRIAPVVIGASRKSFIGRMTGVERPADRVAGSVGAALAAAARGAAVLRVHDVLATRRALSVFVECYGA